MVSLSYPQLWIHEGVVYLILRNINWYCRVSLGPHQLVGFLFCINTAVFVGVSSVRQTDTELNLVFSHWKTSEGAERCIVGSWRKVVKLRHKVLVTCDPMVKSESRNEPRARWQTDLTGRTTSSATLKPEVGILD